MKRAVVIVGCLVLGAAACRPRAAAPSYVDTANPFLLSTVVQFRLAARDAMERKDSSALANEVFFLKRQLPVAWVSVVDASGTVLMDSNPRAIAAVVDDPLSRASLGYADTEHPLVRHLRSADDRPVLDLTLPVVVNLSGSDERAGYVRIGFIAGDRLQNWAEPEK